MFIGHFGAGLAAKKVDTKPSLGTMFFAAQLFDLIWPVFLLLGIEKVKIVPGISAANPLDFTYYPWSHSLLIVLFWSFLFGIIYFRIKKNLKSSVVLSLLVLSHWILDLLVHIPDLPLWPGSDIKVGFGLWNSVVSSVLLEFIIFAAGVYLYLNVTQSKNRKGTFGFWGLIAFLVIIYVTNIFSPPPPSAEAIGYAGLLQWLFIPWAYWVDRNRSALITNAKLQPDLSSTDINT
jgi:membrane-bound metal-dependent hydrolase YbcI (DUF457 family)